MNKNIVMLHKLAFLALLLYSFLNIFFVLYFKSQPVNLVIFLAAIFLLFVARFFLTFTEITIEIKLSFYIFLLCWGAYFLQVMTQDNVTDLKGRDVHTSIFFVLLVSMFWFSIGAMISGVRYKESNYVALMLMFLIWVSFASDVNMGPMISYAGLADAGAEGVDHLLLAELILLVGLVAYSFSHGILKYFIILAVAFFVFSGGGRSTFYFGVLGIIIYEILTRSFIDKLKFGLIFGLCLATGFLYILNFSGDGLVGRMLFLDGLEGDGSFVQRGEFFEDAVYRLVDQFWFGNPGLIVSDYGTLGGYAHNIISAWQFFGFFGFLSILTLLVRLSSEVFPKINQYNICVDRLGGVCLIYAILGIIFSKYIGFIFLWFSMGYWVFRFNPIFQKYLKID